MSTPRTLAAAAALAAPLLLPSVALGAIDDQGMAYVSASQGLSGRIQMRWEDISIDDAWLPFAADDAIVDGTLKAEAVRLYLKGDLDVGGGYKSTYGAELRGESGTLVLHSYHAGLAGPFGAIDFGRLANATDALVPSGSLDAVAGSGGSTPWGNPGDHRLRYTSPPLGGFKVGFAVEVDGANEAGEPGGSFDAYDAAIHYTHPLGVTAGVGLQKVKEAGLDGSDAEGWLLGASYARAGWTVAYEYRRFESFALIPLSISFGQSTLAFGADGSDYAVHRVAAQFKLDRLTASANYSKEVETPVATPGTPALLDTATTALGVDLAYALGSKSRIAVGVQDLKSQTLFPDDRDGDDEDQLKYGVPEAGQVFILDYQVNF